MQQPGVEKLQGQGAKAVHQDPVAPFLKRIPRVTVGVHVGEDIENLHFHHHPRGALADGLVEILEIPGKDGVDVQVQTDGTGHAPDIAVRQHRQHPLVQRLGQVLEQPWRSEQIDLGRDPFLQFDHGNEILAEEDAAWPVRANLQAGLFANQVGDPGALQFLVDGRQVQGAQGFALLPVIIDLVLGPLLFAPLGLDGQVVGDADEGRVVLRLAEVVPVRKRVLEGLILGGQQRVLAEQRPHFVDGGVGVIDGNVPAYQDQVRVVD